MPSDPVESRLLKSLPALFALLGLFVLAGLMVYLEKPTGSLDGRLFNEAGKPIAGAQVSVDAYPINFQTRTDVNGAFQIDQLPVGKYYLQANSKGYQGYYSQDRIEIGEGQRVHLDNLVVKELEPNLYVEMWEDTKLPDQKVTVTLSGAKVQEVQFTIYRLNVAEYLAKGGEFSALAERDTDPSQLSGAQQIQQHTETIPPEDVPEFNRKVKLKLDGKGVYLIHAAATSTDRLKVFTQNQLVNVTDLGFVAKRDATKLLINASSFLTPQPVAGAQVLLIGTDAKQSKAETNAQGIAEIDLAAAGFDSRDTPFVILTHQDSTAYMNSPGMMSDGYSDEGEGEAADAAAMPRIFLYTERPLYRPGHRVYFKGIARTENAQGRYDVVAMEPVEVTISNPKGDILYEQSLTTNAFGSFWGELDLEEEADLGYYNIVATLRGKENSKEFEVDEYRKPEFKVEIQPDKERYYPGDKISFLIDTQFYFGAPLEAEVEYTIYKSPYYFSPSGEEDTYDFYRYDYEGGHGGYGEFVEEGKLRTDENGKATVVVDAPKAEEDQKITLRVTAKDITERTVTKENDAIVVMGDFYFRTKKTEFLAKAGQPYSLMVVARDYQGKPVGIDYQIRVEREQWDPIASQYDYSKVETVKGKTGADGLGSSQFKVNRGGYYRLAISGKDGKGRRILFHDYLWVSGTAQDSEGYGLEKSLIAIADKKKFQAGESARLFIVGPVKDANVLVSIEGSKIHEYRLEKLDGFSKEIQIPLKKEWIPNIFVSVTAIGKKEFYESSVELKISPVENYLTVDIQPNAQKYQPGGEISYQVTTKDQAGRPVPAEISLGVVDESLYALKADKTDVKEFFWGPKPNRVGMNYSFSGYYSGGIEKEDQRLLRKNFKDTAYWAPSIVTNELGEASVSFKLPDNLTTWRATVVAQDLATEVGQQINKVISGKDLIVRLAIPRFFTERDRASLKALVQNYTEKDQTLQVSMGLKGLEFANPKDGETRSLTVAPKKTVSFDVGIVAKTPGQATIQFLAKNEAVSDGFEIKIPILPYGTEDHQYSQGEVVPQGSPSNVELSFPPKANPSSTKLAVTLDSSLMAQLLGPVSYLVQYPYGCVEQTTSRLLGALTVANLYQTLGISDPMLEKRIPKVVKKGLKRLANLQHNDGGWGWWKNDPDDPFMTAYAMYGLLRAQALGENVNAEILKKGGAALEKMLKQGISSVPQMTSAMEEQNRYFVHYVASLAGIANKPSIPEGTALKTKMAQSYLILALELQGRHEDALRVLAGLKRDAICSEGLCHFSEDKLTYTGDAEATSWALQAIMKADPADKGLQESIVRWLLAQRRGGVWRQTRETAAAIYALSEYARELPGTKAGVKASLTLNAKELEKVNVASPHFVRRLSPVDLKVGKNVLSMLNLGEHVLHYQTDLSYYSQEDPLMPSSSGIKVSREYFRLKAKRSGTEVEKSFEASELKDKIAKGETIGVRVTIESAEPLRYVVIEDPLPSGFEVVDGVSFDKDARIYTEMETHDEMVAFFLTYMEAGKYIMNYGLRPEIPGFFYAMPTKGSEMYQPEVRGASGSTKLEVQ